MSALLLFFIFSFVSPIEKPIVEIGMNTTFDQDNKEFKLNYTGKSNDGLLAFIEYEGGPFCTFSIAYDFLDFQSESLSNNAILFYQDSPKNSYTIQFGISDGDIVNGTFKIYSFRDDLKIKLKNKYGNINLPLFKTEFKKYDIPTHLTFSINNLDRDVTVKFDYNPEIKFFSQSYYFDNPFEVCIENNCKNNITSYDFKKGNSYKIKVNMLLIEEGNNFKYVIPGFEFYDINYKGIDSPDDIEYDNDKDNDDDNDKDNYYRGLKLKYFMIFLMLLSLF